MFLRYHGEIFQPKIVASSVTRTGSKGHQPLRWSHCCKVVEVLDRGWAVTREAEVCWITLRLPQGKKHPENTVAKNDDVCSTAMAVLLHFRAGGAVFVKSIGTEMSFVELQLCSRGVSVNLTREERIKRASNHWYIQLTSSLHILPWL